MGKWGLGEAESSGVPNRQGFDYFFGYLNQKHAHNYYPDHLWKNEEKFPLEGNVVSDGVATQKTQYSHDLFMEEALAFLEKNQKETFFLYLAMTIPHANNEAGKAGMEVPSDEPYSKQDWPQPQKNHAAMITRMDAGVGRVMQKLKDLGLDEKTVVFFTSDNGPHKEGGGDPEFFHSSGPYTGYKRSLTDGGIRVPTMVRWPGKIQPGVSAQPWAFWDFLPTAAQLAGAETPKNLDGISIAPTLLGQKGQAKHPDFYWEFHERGFLQAALTGDGQWKGIRSNLGKLQLFNLKEDVPEKNNVAQAHPEIASRLAQFLDDSRTESKEFPIKLPDNKTGKKANTK